MFRRRVREMSQKSSVGKPSPTMALSILVSISSSRVCPEGKAGSWPDRGAGAPTRAARVPRYREAALTTASESTSPTTDTSSLLVFKTGSSQFLTVSREILFTSSRSGKPNRLSPEARKRSPRSFIMPSGVLGRVSYIWPYRVLERSRASSRNPGSVR